MMCPDGQDFIPTEMCRCAPQSEIENLLGSEKDYRAGYLDGYDDGYGDGVIDSLPPKVEPKSEFELQMIIKSFESWA